MKKKTSKEMMGVDHDVVDAEPKPKKRRITRAEKVITEEPMTEPEKELAKKPAKKTAKVKEPVKEPSEEPVKEPSEEIAKKLAEEDAMSLAVLDKVEQFGKTTDILAVVDQPNESDDDMPAAGSPFAKYDKMIEEDEDDEDNRPRPIKRQVPVVSHSEPNAPSGRGRGAKGRKKDTGEGEFVIDDDSASISSLTKGNVWASNVDEIYQMLMEGRRTEHWAENRVHYMNIIAPVFDVQIIDNTNKQLVASLEEANYKVFSYPKSRDDKKTSIAIRKHQIKKITDLTMENILHLSAAEVLTLIDENMGTGWKGLPLAIQDIIETAFYVDCSVLPEAAMRWIDWPS